jgi:ATP-dependent exoDNAse (exonuclease V) beta subunit
MEPQVEAALANLGVDLQHMQKAVHKTLRALRNTLSHEQGRWILASHAQHACELPLTVHDQASRHYVIDRTFVDDQGTRWIIDYKTGEHLEEDVEAFLDAEQERYREQLENYARILQLIENRPTRTVLYFPLLQDWRVWTPTPPE